MGGEWERHRTHTRRCVTIGWSCEQRLDFLSGKSCETASLHKCDRGLDHSPFRVPCSPHEEPSPQEAGSSTGGQGSTFCRSRVWGEDKGRRMSSLSFGVQNGPAAPVIAAFPFLGEILVTLPCLAGPASCYNPRPMRD